MVEYHSAFLPTRSQQRLLEAALWEGPKALAAWESWRACRRIETADTGSQRLAPLLYYNLRRSGWDDPEMSLLKGTFRKAWAHNERLANMVAPLFKAWGDLGIPAALLKGAALALRYYPHGGARPMDDLDMLVPVRNVNAAMEAFRQGAWLGAKGRTVPRRFDDDHLRRKRTQRLVSHQGLELELHWYLLEGGRSPDVDDAVWRHAQPVRIRDANALVPGPEHLLLHVLAHGAEWNAVPPIRWIADAWMILSGPRSARFDWELMLAEVTERRLALPVRTCLRYLNDAMGTAVPAGVLETLDAAKASPAEWAEFRMLELPKPKRSPLLVLWLRHLRMQGLTASPSWLGRIAKLPDSLRVLWRLRRRWHVPIAAAGFLFGRSAGAHVILMLRRRRSRAS